MTLNTIFLLFSRQHQLTKSTKRMRDTTTPSNPHPTKEKKRERERERKKKE
jgi:hypothetical protein